MVYNIDYYEAPPVASLFYIRLIIVGELFLSLWGPMPRLNSPPVILTPVPDNANIEDELAEDIYRAVESHMVRSGSFSIIKRSRWDDYFQNNPDKVEIKAAQNDFVEIARDLEINKVLVVFLYGSESCGYTLYLSLRDSARDLLMKSVTCKFTTIGELTDSEKIISEFSSDSRRLSLYNYFFILLLFLQIVLTLFIVLKKQALVLQEAVLIMTLVLFLFS